MELLKSQMEAHVEKNETQECQHFDLVLIPSSI